MEAMKGLPDDASYEDAMERLLLLAKIERGMKQADAGQTISHAEVKQWMAKRLGRARRPRLAEIMAGYRKCHRHGEWKLGEGGGVEI